jgi:CMP/dCMP kinase
VIIAVDGPAAAGKGTIARALAFHYGFHFLDTGTLYRRVGLALLKAGRDLNDIDAATKIADDLNATPFEDAELRTEEVGSAASIVASIPAVRSALLEFQRRFAAQKPGAVLDGRDIGTVVCPTAEIKLFVTASAKIRGERRFAELRGAGQQVTFEAVMDDIRGRDERDRTRAVAPLLAAADAVILDTSDMPVEEAIGTAIRIADRILAT